jgi:para-aminobenzoate synthetase/4-amino-4-deoxychorismate lyase
MPGPPPPDPKQGLFETLLVAHGQPVQLDAHLERLRGSTRRLFGADLPEGTEQAILEAARPIGLGRLRVDVCPGPAGELTHSAAAAEVDPELVFPSWENAAALRSVPAGAWSGQHKWADREWLERTESSLGDRVPLLVGDDSTVLEAGRANVFAVRRGDLVTPPLDGRILPGTARAAVLELAAELGIHAEERPLGVEELRGAEEAFLSSSVRGLRPVREVDGRPLPGPGEVTERLAAELRRRWLGG